jgi:hypothetical protein
MKRFITCVVVLIMVVAHIGCASTTQKSTGTGRNELAPTEEGDGVVAASSTNRPTTPRPRPGTAVVSTTPTFNYGETLVTASAGPLVVPEGAKVVVIQPPKKIGFALFDVDVNIIPPAGPRPVRIIKRYYYPPTIRYGSRIGYGHHRHHDDGHYDHNGQWHHGY